MTERYRKALLHTPEGVWDHYGSDCREYEAVETGIREIMHRYGYEDIKTPAFEFFDVFSREIGTRPSRELYKFFDKEGNTLVLRPDFTPSVARCAAKYFMEETRPLRFCYEGSAFSNTSSLQGRLRETTQMGVECINDGTVQADAEQLALLTEALMQAGLTRFQITVGNVEYFRGICEAAGLDEETELILREAVSGKNYFAAQRLLREKNVAAESAERFLQITSLAGNEADLRSLQKNAPNERSFEAVGRLIRVYRILKLYGYEQYISFDLSLLSNYNYYTGILFKGYTYGVGDRIASGGRYDTLLSQFGKNAPSVGFMIEIDTLMEALRAQNAVPDAGGAPEVISYRSDVPGDYEAALKKAQKMRGEGYRVVLTQCT